MDNIIVAQADRDAAAEYMRLFPELRLPEAFARHRQSSIASLIGGVGIVSLQNCIGAILEAVEPLLRFHETGGHEGDGSDKQLAKVRAVLSTPIGSLPALTPSPLTDAPDADRIATSICQSVAEIPDRSSPDDQPDIMLVTADELHTIVTCALENERAALTTPAAKDDAGREAVLFNLTWITPPSPELPDGRRVHPEPMTGRQSFTSLEKVVRFMSKRCAGTEFVSLTQTTSCTVDRSAEFRAFGLSPQSDEGEERRG